jgi:hypothetical protein
MPRPTIANLSIFQALGLIVTAGGGSAVWLVAAAIAQPADLGALGRVVSTGTLLAGLITAGLGQFLLTVMRSLPTERVRSYLWASILAGGALSALAGAGAGAWQSGRLDWGALATGLLAGGIAVTNLQDALYLGSGLAQDVPAKGAAIVLARLGLLLACALVAVDLAALLVIFVVSQLAVGIGWIAVRAPKAFGRHQPLKPAAAGGGARDTLMFSYLYSLAVAAIGAGVPALVTSLAAPERAGAFFVAWTMSGLLSGLSVAVANSVIAVSLEARGATRRLASVLAGMLSALCAGGMLIAFALPQVLALVNPRYGQLAEQIQPLVAGQICFGVAIVSLAAYRALALDRYLIGMLIAWPLVVLSGVLAGLYEGGVARGATGFLVGNLIAALPICLLAFRATAAHERHDAWIVPALSMAGEGRTHD